jgi:hypothetical protein
MWAEHLLAVCPYLKPHPHSITKKQARKREREREMRSMKGEVVLNIPAEKAWEMYRDNDIISKINPQMLARAEYIEGDGNPGSLRVFKLGPGIYPSIPLSQTLFHQLKFSNILPLIYIYINKRMGYVSYNKQKSNILLK